MPITWRNIDIGSNQSANALINAGGDQIVQGISGLGDIVGGINKVGAANVDARTNVNTENALATLAGITDSKGLAEAMGAGGALNKDTIKDAVGAEIDLNAVTAAFTAQREKIVKRETDAKIHEDNLSQQAANRLTEADRFNKNYELAKQNADQNREKFQFEMTNAKAQLAKDKSAQLHVMNLEKLVNAGGDFVKLQRDIEHYKASGIQEGGDAGIIENAAATVLARLKTGVSSPLLTQQMEASTKAFGLAETKLDTEATNVLNRFKEQYEYNPDLVSMLGNTALAGQTIEAMTTDLMGKGELETKDTEEGGPKGFRELKNLVEEKTGFSVPPVAVYELYKRVGHEDNKAWGMGWTTTVSTENQTAIDEFARELSIAKSFTKGGHNEGLMQKFEHGVLATKQLIADRQRAELNDMAMAKYQQTVGARINPNIAVAEYDPTKSGFVTGTRKDTMTGQTVITKVANNVYVNEQVDSTITHLEELLRLNPDNTKRPLTPKEARAAKQLDDAAKTVLKNSTGEPTTTWGNSSFFPDKAKLAAEKKAKYGE